MGLERGRCPLFAQGSWPRIRHDAGELASLGKDESGAEKVYEAARNASMPMIGLAYLILVLAFILVAVADRVPASAGP
jgi:uncharacterized membrane protein